MGCDRHCKCLARKRHWAHPRAPGRAIAAAGSRCPPTRGRLRSRANGTRSKRLALWPKRKDSNRAASVARRSRMLVPTGMIQNCLQVRRTPLGAYGDIVSMEGGAKRAPGSSHREWLTIVKLLWMFPNDATAETRVRGAVLWGRHPVIGLRGARHGMVNQKTMPYRCRKKTCRAYFGVSNERVMQSSKLGLRRWTITI